MNLRGALVDFGSTLAYVDEEDGRRYREGLGSILRSYGWEKTMIDLSPLLDNA